MCQGKTPQEYPSAFTAHANSSANAEGGQSMGGCFDCAAQTMPVSSLRKQVMPVSWLSTRLTAHDLLTCIIPIEINKTFCLYVLN